MDVSTLLALAERCAPSVAAETLLSVAYTESRFNPFAIGVNGAARLSRQPSSKPEAVRIASDLLRAGRNIDVGLSQINSKNLAWLRLSVEDAFDPCKSLAASARVLELGFRSGVRSTAEPQAALKIALSMYNTGDPGRGFRNGYVTNVVSSAGHVVPAIVAARGEVPRTSFMVDVAQDIVAVPAAPAFEAVTLKRVEEAPSPAGELEGSTLVSEPTPERRPELDVFARDRPTSKLVFER